MTDNTCNGWRNAATWTVNLWFGDTWADMSHEGDIITAEYLRDMVEEDVYSLIGKDSTVAGFIWDMLDLNTVDWDGLRDHYAPAEAVA